MGCWLRYVLCRGGSGKHGLTLNRAVVVTVSNSYIQIPTWVNNNLLSAGRLLNRGDSKPCGTALEQTGCWGQGVTTTAQWHQLHVVGSQSFSGVRWMAVYVPPAWLRVSGSKVGPTWTATCVRASKAQEQACKHEHLWRNWTFVCMLVRWLTG